MFGYVIPDKMNMYIKDYSLFRAYYCGLCKSLAKSGCPHTRFCTNYDCTFLNALVHSIKNEEVELKNEVCVLNPLRKKSVVKTDAISKRVADVTVLLIYYKLGDDVVDGKKSRVFSKASLRSRSAAASRREPKIAELIKQSYGDLRKLEKENCDSVDRACEPFAKLLENVTAELAGEIDGATRGFCYNLGKLVYLFDALDDLEKDSAKKTYNPLIAAFGVCADKQSFVAEHKDELDFLLNMCYNRLVEDYNSMNITVSEGVLSNTVYLGLKMQMDKLLKGEEKCAMTRL